MCEKAKTKQNKKRDGRREGCDQIHASVRRTLAVCSVLSAVNKEKGKKRHFFFVLTDLSLPLFLFVREIGSLLLLLDCGFSEPYEQELLRPLLRRLPHIDAVLLSHGDAEVTTKKREKFFFFFLTLF